MLNLLRFLIILFIVSCTESGCTPAANAPQSASPVTLGPVSASGSCDARVSVGLTIGPLHLPLSIDAQTTGATDGQTRGSVLVDAGGWLRATCLISPETPDGACTLTGPLAPRPQGVSHDATP